MITPEEVPRDIASKIFHFGSVSMTTEPSRSATIEAIRRAKARGALISYDPNYRKPLWRSEAEAVEVMRSACQYADLIKIAEEELLLLTGETLYTAGAARLEAIGARLIMITLGEKGAYFKFKGAEALLPAYAVKTVDTTGAGDAFTGAVLSRLCRDHGSSLDSISLEAMTKMIDFANAAGSLATTKFGAIPALPEYGEIIDCMEKTGKLS